MTVCWRSSLSCWLGNYLLFTWRMAIRSERERETFRETEKENLLVELEGKQEEDLTKRKRQLHANNHKIYNDILLLLCWCEKMRDWPTS